MLRYSRVSEVLSSLPSPARRQTAAHWLSSVNLLSACSLTAVIVLLILLVTVAHFFFDIALDAVVVLLSSLSSATGNAPASSSLTVSHALSALPSFLPPPSNVSRLTLRVPSPLDPTVTVHPDVAALLQQATEGLQPIPHIVHFVIGAVHTSTFAPTVSSSPAAFTLTHYLSMRSAAHVLSNSSIICHVVAEPAPSQWWERARSLCSLTVPARALTSIFGRPVYHRQHKSDILRLEALLQYGGVALDLDVIVLQDWDAVEYHSRWLDVDLLLGHAQTDGSQWPDRLDAGVVAARKSSWFLKEWFATYRVFDCRQQLRASADGWQTYRDDFTAFFSSLAYRLSSSRPHLLHIAPVNQYGRPYAAEPSGRSRLYSQKGSPHAELMALHLWQGEFEWRRESEVKRAVEAVLEPQAVLINTVQEVCEQAERSLYGAALKRALLSGPPDFSCPTS